MKNERTTNKAMEKAPFDLAASILRDAGFKQVLILATRLDSADDAERIDVSDKRELKKYGSHVFQAMDTITMLASVGSHIEGLIREHPEEKEKVAHFVMKLIDDIIDDETEAMN